MLQVASHKFCAQSRPCKRNFKEDPVRLIGEFLGRRLRRQIKPVCFHRSKNPRNGTFRKMKMRPRKHFMVLIYYFGGLQCRYAAI